MMQSTSNYMPIHYDPILVHFDALINCPDHFLAHLNPTLHIFIAHHQRLARNIDLWRRDISLSYHGFTPTIREIPHKLFADHSVQT